MPVLVSWLVGAVLAVLAGWAVIGTVGDRRPADAQLYGLAVVEVLLLLRALVLGGRLVAGFEVDSTVTVVGYLISTVLVLPVGVVWGVSDRSRWGNGVLAVACATGIVLEVRLVQVLGA